MAAIGAGVGRGGAVVEREKCLLGARVSLPCWTLAVMPSVLCGTLRALSEKGPSLVPERTQSERALARVRLRNDASLWIGAIRSQF